MRTALLCLAALLCATGVSAHAQEKPIPESEAQANQLPEPGTWVKFLVSTEDPEASDTLTVRMLDVVLDDNERFRRIEYDWLVWRNGEKWRSVTQFLTSEKSLVRETAPFDSLKQMRTVTLKGARQNGGPILESEVSTSDVNEATRTNLNIFGWGVFFPGVRKEQAIKQETIEIQYQHGLLNCSQLIEIKEASDLTELVKDNKNIDRYLRQTNFRIWLHPKVPFGVAQFERRRSDIAYDQQGEILAIDPFPLMTWTLIDFGTGAKSALPDSK